MKSYFICFLIAVSLLVHNVVLGQAPACFTLDYPKGCLPHTVTVDGSCASGYTSIGYDFINAGTYPTTPTTHTYSGTGNFRIIQFITTSGGNKYDTAFANVITATKPVITVKTCSGLRVDVTINDAVYDYYTIDYGDGSPLKSPVAPLTTDTKIYSGAGTRTIIVTGYFSSSNSLLFPAISCGVGSITTTTVSPVATLPTPDITFLEVTNEGVANGEIQVHFNAVPEVNYIFSKYTDVTPQAYVPFGTTITNATGPIVQTISGINTTNEFTCVKIRAIDLCTGSAVASNEICSIMNFNVQAQNLQNQLTWSPYPILPVNDTQIDRNSNTVVNSGATSGFIDNSVVCATQYCYQVRTLLSIPSSTTAYSLSAKKCVTAISTAIPTAVTNVNSSINGNATQVVFDAPVGFTVKKYQIFDSNGNEVNNGTATSTSFSAGAGKCYYVNYVDNCNNTSTSSTTTCTVNLNATLEPDGSVACTWSAYSGYTSTGIASYDLLLLDGNGNVITTIPAGIGFSASDIPNANSGSLFYVVRVNSGGAENIISYSNKVEISLTPTVYIPNAFTPNGDNVNDEFMLKSKFVTSIEVSIYNKWGEPVFYTNDPNTSWNGKIKGADAPVDSYAYVVTFSGNSGESSTERGTVSLIR